MDDTEARILQDIERTRAAMTEKITMIQNRMEATVEETGATVTRVINGVMEQVERVQGLIAHITSTADEAVTRVQTTAQRTTADGTPETNLIHDIYQRPWIVMGTAVFLGYLLGSSGRPSTASSPGHVPSPAENDRHGITADVPTGNPFITPAGAPAGRTSTPAPDRTTRPAGAPSARP